MLPLAGMPIAVLAAKRAGNTGIPVVLATSVEKSDDALSALGESYGLPVFRGSLDNTLDRFVQALAGLDDDAIVFRLTADNVVPDGMMLDEMEAYFVAGGFAYLACNGIDSGLPYGVSVEVTRVKYLREAALHADAEHDLEHVMPFVRRTHGTAYYAKYEALNLSRLRCTVDNFDDYLQVLDLFNNLSDPVSATWLELVNKLAELDPLALRSNTHHKLVLGGAQFGLNYGIANKDGKPAAKVAHSLIKRAVSCGVAYIDTAHAYGNSESVIGDLVQGGWRGRFKVITKLAPLSDLQECADQRAVRAHVQASVFRSCASLGTETLDVLMLHRATHLTSNGGSVWSSVVELHQEGVISSVGVSVQNAEEAMLALDEPKVAFLQLPFNVLDYRWERVIEKIRMIKRRRPLVVHARSSLLQGLLASQDRRLWERAHVSHDEADKILAWLQSAVAAEGRDSVIDLCVSYVASQDWVDGVVLGMETEEQLLANLVLFSRPLIGQDRLERLTMRRPQLAARSLDPARWLNS